MFKNLFVILLVAAIFTDGCIIKLSDDSSLSSIVGTLQTPLCSKINLKFSTVKSNLPATIKWTIPGAQAQELINQQDRVVILSGGSNPMPPSQWATFQPTTPYSKNIERNILFKQTFFFRSPNTTTNCQETNSCITIRQYNGYSWIELAKSLCAMYVPGTTDILKPAKGYVAIKTILKCQLLYFDNFFYQLTDNKGNFYAMHATETGMPDMNVALPVGWSIKNVTLAQPLIVQPVSGGDNCYFNVLGDALGQGYHQYIWADSYYPTA